MYYEYSYLYGGGYVKGRLGGTATTLWTGTPTEVILMGDYSSGYEESGPPYLMYGSGVHVFGTTKGTSAGPPSGAFRGYLVGLWYDGAMRGQFLSLYINPDGQAGYLKSSGEIAGYNYSFGMWMASGNLTAETPQGPTSITPADLSNSLYSNYFEGNSGYQYGGYGGLTLTTAAGDPLRINDSTYAQNWGIWNAGFGGTYESIPSGNWELRTGGLFRKGLFEYDEDGYWIGEIAGSAWGNPELSGTFTARALTNLAKYDLTDGYIMGTYKDTGGSGEWQAAGIGRYTMYPLAFSGYWGDSEGSLYYYSGGYMTSTGEEEYGLFGSLDKPWDTPAALYAMGKYDDYGYGGYARLWNTLLLSPALYVAGWPYSPFLEGDHAGYTAGIWKNGIMDGAAVALYLSEDGKRAGILTTYDPSSYNPANPYFGGIQGKYYPDITMWEVTQSTLTERFFEERSGEKSTPFNVSLRQMPFDVQVRGYFEDESYISGSGQTNAVYFNDNDSGKALPWGIYNLKLDGGENGWFSNDPENLTGKDVKLGGRQGNPGTPRYGYWLGDLQNTIWSDGEIRGKLAGSYLSRTQTGSFSGPFYGLYEEAFSGAGYGGWIGQSVGTYTGNYLAFSAQIEAAYHYYEEEYVNYLYQDFNGILGTTTSPFTSATTINEPGNAVTLYVMGKSDPKVELDKTTWWGSLSGSVAGDGSEIPNGHGFIGGRTYVSGTNTHLEGMLISLYLANDSDGSAGILEGSFTGASYQISDYEIMFESTSGSIRATKKAVGYGDTYSTQTNSIGGNFLGTFGGTTITGYMYQDYGIYGISYGYLGSYTAWLRNAAEIDETWGIFNMELGGWYYDTPSNNWKLNLGGKRWRELEEYEYWIAKVQGSQWSDEGGMGNRIAGDFVYGRYMTPTSLGTINGKLLGSYDTYELGTWEAIALGTFEKTNDLVFSAAIDAAYHYGSGGSVSWYDYHEGLLGTTVSPFASATVPDTPGDAVPFYMMGKAWPDGLVTWWGPLSGSLAGDGSTIPYGYIGGRTSNLYVEYPTPSEHLEGILVSLYIDQSGKAGILEGSFTGSYYPLREDMGMFEVNATGENTIRATMKATGYDPSNYTAGYYQISGKYYGTLLSEAYTIQSSGYLGSYTAWLTKVNEDTFHEPWGIFSIELGGTYTGTPPMDDWQLKLGGTGWRGINEYWIATVEGSQWSDIEDGKGKRIAGTLTGKYLTTTAKGTISNGTLTHNVLGSYDSYASSTWEAIALGTFTEEQLKYVSSSAADITSQGISQGNLQFLMGETTSLWDGTDIPVTIIGTYSNSAVRGIFHTAGEGIEEDIYSHNYITGEHTTYDELPGAYRGWIGGIVNNHNLEGKFLALYIDPSGNAGYLRTKLRGQGYPEIGMFEMYTDATTGYMNREQVKTAAEIGIPAGQLNNGNYHASDMNWGYGGFQGAFDGDDPGTITGNPPDAGTLSIINNITEDPRRGEVQNWGIFGFDSHGEYTTPTSPTWAIKAGGKGGIGAYSYYDYSGDIPQLSFSDDPGYWIADITGSVWDNNKFNGAVTGRFITQTRIGHPDLIYDTETEKWIWRTTQTIPGTGMNGDLLGVYGDGTWDAVALGVWSGASLALSGKIAEEGPTYYGITGLIGGIHPRVQGAPTVTVDLAMGEYSMIPSSTDYWTAKVGGKMSEATESGTNIDKPIYWLASIGGNYDNSFNGYGGYGGWSGGNINAALSGEYFSSSGKGTITASSFPGQYYEGIKMWEAENFQLTLNQTDAFYVYGYLGYDTVGGNIKGIIGSTNSLNFEEPVVYFDAMGTGSSFEGIWGKIGGKGVDSDSRTFYYLGDVQNNDGITLSGEFLHPFIAGSFYGEMYPEDIYYNIDFWRGWGYMYFCPEGQCNDLAYVSEASTKPYYFDGSKIVQDRETNFLMGGVDSIFGESYVLMIGEYLHTTSNPSLFPTPDRGYIWHTTVASRNFNITEPNDPAYFTTYDGGKYKGFLGGTIIPNGDGTDAVEGMFYALGMIDGSGGFLKGSMAGTGYQEIRMFEMDGTITGIEMGSVSSDSFTFTDPVSARHITPGTFDTEGGGNIYVNHTVSIDGQAVSSYRSANITDITDWGIWQTATVGTYAAPTADTWTLPLEMNDIPSGKIREMEIAGTQWSDNKLAGDVTGYWADISTAAPATGIHVGELKGTFNPVDTTWQAVAMGPWIETSKYLDMTVNNQTALQALNIPCVQVGSVSLAGTKAYVGGSVTVNMNDMQFFAYSSGAPARLWATAPNNPYTTSGVQGSYTGVAPSQNTVVPLSATGFTADFTLKRFDAVTTNKWLSTVNGTGGFNGSTTFKGAGAGTINTTNSTFSGTAAGIAK